MIEHRRVADRAALRAAYDALHHQVVCSGSHRFYRWVLALVDATPGARLLDVACGRGGLVCQARASGLRAVGVDLSTVALDHAGLPGLVACADGERLPFAAGRFERVLNLGGLEHFLDPAAALQEMARVAAPGARLWLMLPNARYSGDLWRALRGARGPDHHQPVERFATCGEWRAFLESAGLHVLRVLRYDKFKPWKRLLPSALAYHFLYECAPSAT